MVHCEKHSNYVRGCKDCGLSNPSVFFDAGGGDIYAGRSREEVLDVMRDEAGEDFIEGDVFEVEGSMLMKESDENDLPTGRLVALRAVYGDDIDAYCIATENY